MRPSLASLFISLPLLGAPAHAEPPAGAAVNGFGGFFFAAEDPEELAKWYKDHLGITRAPKSYDAIPWKQDAGPTVFEPFPTNFPAFKASSKVFMLNFRTADLDELVKHLRTSGITVDVDETTYPNGRFAHLSDPEGNLIQLWEPTPTKP
ncbi:MAG: VOC family protein [Parvularculaceae bacterium]|nr:VOC family protein [Parvularculaceae bacterium]